MTRMTAAAATDAKGQRPYSSASPTRSVVRALIGGNPKPAHRVCTAAFTTMTQVGHTITTTAVTSDSDGIPVHSLLGERNSLAPQHQDRRRLPRCAHER